MVHRDSPSPKADPFQRLKPQDLRTFGDMVAWLPMVGREFEQKQQEALRSFEMIIWGVLKMRLPP